MIMNKLCKRAHDISSYTGLNMPNNVLIFDKSYGVENITIPHWLHHAWLGIETSSGLDETAKKILLTTAVGDMSSLSVFGAHIIHAFNIVSLKNNVDNYDDILKDVIKMSLATKETCSHDICGLLVPYRYSSFSKKMLDLILKHVGSGISTIINNDPASSNYVEMIHGYRFPITPSNIDAIESEQRKFKNCLVITIDGIIEKPSEIERIMYHLNNENMSGIIVCRGVRDDVQSTINQNVSRGVLSIAMVIIPVTYLGNAMFKDICTLAGGVSVDHMLGDMISSLDMNKLNVCPWVLIENSAITFMHDSNDTLFVDSLSDKDEIVSHQKKWRTGKHCRISIQSNHHFVKRKDELESMLKLYSITSSHGILSIREALGIVKTPTVSAILLDLEKKGFDKLPSFYFLIAIKKAISLFRDMKNCAYIIKRTN